MKYILVATCCVLVLLGGCSRAEAPTAADAATARLTGDPSRESRHRNSAVHEPRGGAEDGGDGAAVSWDDFVSLQAPSDQEYLQDLDHRYFGVVSFETTEERDYMMRAGFPSPEEWLAAKQMSDSELQDRADAGDPKAAGMLADRMSVRLEELIALARQDPDAVTDADRVRIATAAVAYSSRAMDGSNSPFGLYVEGMVKSSIFDSWEPMTAAMIESMNRGDPRVDRLIGELHARHPVQDVQAIHVALRGMTRQYP